MDTEPTPDTDPIALTVPQACRKANISRAHLYRYLGTRIPVIRLGRSVRIHRDDLERFLNEQRVCGDE